MLVQRGRSFLICNNVFQHGKTVSHSISFSAPGRTVCVWDPITKGFITFCDLQFLGHVKEYINKVLGIDWGLMHPFVHGKLLFFCFVYRYQCRS